MRGRESSPGRAKLATCQLYSRDRSRSDVWILIVRSRDVDFSGSTASLTKSLAAREWNIWNLSEITFTSTENGIKTTLDTKYLSFFSL